MSQIIIELNEIIPELNALELLLLKTIYTSNIDGFNVLCSAYNTHIPLILKSLENKAYIKINGNSFDKYFYREKAVELFGENKTLTDVDKVLMYLNNKLGKKRGFNLASKGNRKFISARLKDGYTLEDLTKVIDTMYSKWKGSDMEMYLRPETLFNDTKFQTYLMISESKDVRTQGSIFSLAGEA